MVTKYGTIALALASSLLLSSIPARAGGPTGACCFSNGSCTQDLSTNCVSGIYQGDGTTCTPNICPQPPPSTTTTTITPTTSTTTTSTTMLPVSGACCTLSGCSDTTLGPSFCQIELSGTYQGDGTSCTQPNICAAPTTTTTVFSTPSSTQPVAVGACCTRFSCQETEAGLCQGELLGVYEGDGTACTQQDICATAHCGDGCVDFGEQCDDGGTATGDGCGATCQTEACYQCTPPFIGNSKAGTNTVVGGCTPNPSQCTKIGGPGCAVCGNGVLEAGEQCDDSNTANGDCCSSTCQFEQAGAACTDDHQFCDGVETCDGKGTCASSGTPSCLSFNGPCSVGVCDAEANACVAQPANNGQSCPVSGPCTLANSGVCNNGSCIGSGTTLSPTCRWIVVGGLGGTNPKVRVQNGSGSTMKEPAAPSIPNLQPNICADTGKSSGETDGSFVVTQDTGEGIKFFRFPVVQDDIATGGSSLGAKLYSMIPGTGSNAPIAGGLPAIMKTDMSGVIDTSGTSQWVTDCENDQLKLAAAIPILDGKMATQTLGTPGHGLVVPVGASPSPVDVTGLGLSVLETHGLKIGHGATWTLKGGPNDVVMVRITGGRFKLGYSAKVVLDGLKPENVLFYSQWQVCRISPGVQGAGTVFCPNAARKFLVGFGSQWQGTILGGAREIRVRTRAALTHVPFTGF